MSVIIGVDPHKGSHTAVAVDRTEGCVGELRVRSGPGQVAGLLGWAVSFPERTWAIENAAGLGYLLAQQLIAAGERVVDVQPKLAARVRLLATEATNKNDPHDARSVAIAALRSATPRTVRAADHTAVLRLWVRRHRDVARARNQLACRLHALLCDLVPGGLPGQVYASKVDRLLEDIEPDGPVAAARVELATELVADLRRFDEQLADSHKRLAVVVAASKTTTTDIFGVGPVVAATVVGITGDIGRFANRDRFAAFNGTAPVEVSSGARVIYRLSRRGNRQLNHAIHIVAVCQIRHRHSAGRVYYDRKLAEGKTTKEALRCLKRRISDALYARMRHDARTATAAAHKGPGGQPGNDSDASATGSHPATPALRPSHSRTHQDPTTPHLDPPPTTRRTP
jgi:transposase